MNRTLFACRLKAARTIRRMSLEQLAQLVQQPVTKQSLSRYESGIMMPKPALLAAIAQALDISCAYFEGNNLHLDTTMLRTSSGAKLTDPDLDNITSILSYHTERFLNKELKTNMQGHFDPSLQLPAVNQFSDAMKAAHKVRQYWHCGDGPIASVLRLCERRGIKIFEAELPDKVYGLSTWADERHPLMLLDMRPSKTTIERLRFTAAHELGHLLLNFPESAPIEKLCNQFASCFLLPGHTLIEELGGRSRNEIYLEELIDLRELYGVSIAALVHEAHDLHIISRQHYDWWFDTVIKRNLLEEGWGHYAFPETLGKEKRMNARLQHQLHESDY